MRHRLLAGVSVAWISLLFGVLCNAQSIQATQFVTPTPVDSDDLRAFPIDLVCDRREESLNSEGPSWMGITVGQSTFNDVEQLLSALSGEYVFINDDDYDTRFIIPNAIQRRPEIPFSVRFCLVGDKVQVLAVGYLFGLRPNLSDLIAKYGEPNAITWTDNPASRVVFWFEQGIAAEVTVLPNEPNYPPTFGRVDTEIYFPYQEVNGYENRWPYNQTRQFNQFLSWPYEGRDDYGPENPFDFESMIATITVEPSRTPTPTFAPLSATATLTPSS